MRRQVSSFRANNRAARAPQARLIVTALIEQDDSLLLVQLAHGRFAGFWLLPSATVEAEPIERTLRCMVPERTGYPVVDQQLLSVLEEARVDAHTVRFVYRVQVGEKEGQPADAEIATSRWFSREAARQVLEERDIVPTLGVMSLVRSWVEGIPPGPLELMVDDAQCPCGSGFRYPGCCGWDMR